MVTARRPTPDARQIAALFARIAGIAMLAAGIAKLVDVSFLAQWVHKTFAVSDQASLVIAIAGSIFEIVLGLALLCAPRQCSSIGASAFLIFVLWHLSSPDGPAATCPCLGRSTAMAPWLPFVIALTGLAATLAVLLMQPSSSRQSKQECCP